MRHIIPAKCGHAVYVVSKTPPIARIIDKCPLCSMPQPNTLAMELFRPKLPLFK